MKKPAPLRPAALAAAVSPTLTLAQTPDPAAPAAPVAQAAAPGPQGAPAVDTPLLGVAQPSPDCGNLHGLNGRAFCVTAPLAGVGALADTYIKHFESQGWLVAGGDGGDTHPAACGFREGHGLGRQRCHQGQAAGQRLFNRNHSFAS